jgi:hypothetical protein
MPKDTTNNMMDSYFNSDPTNFEETPFHLITTDHPHMVSLGLSTFTTGTLYRWWNAKDGAGNYENHKFFGPTAPLTGNGLKSPKTLLEGTDTGSNLDKASEIGKNQFSFEAWRAEDSGAGQYITKYADGGHSDLWDFVQAGNNEADDPRIYSYADVNLAKYDDKYLTPDGSGGGSFDIPDGKGGIDSGVPFYGVNPITNTIVLNDYINNLELETLDKSQWTQEQFAQAEFILDIQSSKAGYIQWSGYVPFQLSLASGDTGATFVCEKSDWVKFRLYLHSSDAPKSTRRGIAMAKPTFAGPPVDALGRKYQAKEDGRFSAFPEGSKSSEVVGELDMTYNEYTGKWEAGSKQMVGVVVQRIPRAQVLSAERLRNLPPEEMLRNPNDPTSHILFGSGSAMPLNMQNGNPMQWTPNYAQPSDTDENGKFAVICPQESEEKATFRVFNASAKAMETDQYVLLNQIEGMWFCIDFPSGIEDFGVAAGFDGRWDFSYCATNLVHYFRDSGFNRIDYQSIERGFHKKYYQDDPMNSGTYAATTLNLAKDIIAGGYHQFTSFDFMDTLIGGTRATNALGITNPILGPNGETVEKPANGMSTAGFFGCIFPDGYSSDDIAQYRTTRGFDAFATIMDSGSWYQSNQSGPIGDQISRINIGGQNVDEIYFNSNGIGSGVMPFNNAGARHDFQFGFEPEGQTGQPTPLPMFSDTDEKLDQLPADIALNAAPSGENGQPIKSLHHIDLMYCFHDNSAGTIAQTRAYFEQGQAWLRKQTPGGVGGTHHMKSSAFDFKPLVPNRIMFRPLKAELYASFGSVQHDSAALPNTRQYFQQSHAAGMYSKLSPSSDPSREREYGMNVEFSAADGNTGFQVPNMMGNIYSLYNSRWGLQYNIDIPAELNPNLGPGVTPEVYKVSTKASFSNGADSERFHANMYGRSSNYWMHGRDRGTLSKLGTDPLWGGHEYEPAGAVGVIGAVCSVYANATIKFSSDCKLGMWSWGTAGGTIIQRPTWGNLNNYRDFQTTNLFAKIYHAWPREQTIYDPRYFAVHHFNPGITDELDSNGKFVVRRKVVDVVQAIPGGAAGQNKSYKYAVDIMRDIDLRTPCSKALAPTDPPAVNVPHKLGFGTKIYGTRADDGAFVYESLTKSQWSVDTNRRGKLLPYKFKENTVTIPQFKVVLPPYAAGINTSGVEEIYANGGYAVILGGGSVQELGTTFLTTTVVPFYDVVTKKTRTFNPLLNSNEDVVMIVKNPGTEGYKAKDEFTCSVSLGAGLSVLTNPEVGGNYNGKIWTIYTMAGSRDFGYTGFTVVDSGKPISVTSRGVNLFPGGAQPTELGKGFDAQLVRGEVQPVEGVDTKPLVATSAYYHRLSIKSNTETGERNTDGVSIEPFGLDAGTEEMEITLSELSPKGKYDIFFHFHNDISHTAMYDSWGDTVDRFNNDEQWIDVTITST